MNKKIISLSLAILVSLGAMAGCGELYTPLFAKIE